jgi:hypothetical protein
MLHVARGWINSGDRRGADRSLYASVGLVKVDDRDRKRAWKAEQKAAARTAFPLPDAVLQEMFDFVEARIGSDGCDHTRRFTKAWLDERQVDRDKVLAWLDDTGGFCDCEVASNSRDHWDRNR